MSLNLTGSLLISTPGIGDPRFARAVIYLCAHSADGAFGLVVNRVIPMLRLARVLDQVGIPTGPDTPDAPVLSGGPVEGQRGYVLHSDDWADGVVQRSLPGGLALSSSTEVLVAIARGHGPRDFVLALGYAGWAGGQLEAELAANAWLTAPAPRDLVFASDRGDALWSRALKGMGIDPAALSGQVGRA